MQFIFYIIFAVLIKCDGFTITTAVMTVSDITIGRPTPCGV